MIIGRHKRFNGSSGHIVSVLMAAFALFLLLLPHLAFAKIISLEAKQHQGEGQYDFVTILVDAQKLTGKLHFLNSEFSNIGDDEVAKASALKGKHHLDLSKYQHVEFDFSMYASSEMVSFFSPVLSLQNNQYSFFFIGTLKSSKLKGTLYEYVLDYTGHRYLTEIPIK